MQQSSIKSDNMSLKKLWTIKFYVTFTNDHLKFLRYLFLFRFFNLPPSPMA